MFTFLVTQSLRNRLLVLALAAILIVFGLFAASRLPVDVAQAIAADSTATSNAAVCFFQPQPCTRVISSSSPRRVCGLFFASISASRCRATPAAADCRAAAAALQRLVSTSRSRASPAARRIRRSDFLNHRRCRRGTNGWKAVMAAVARRAEIRRRCTASARGFPVATAATARATVASRCWRDRLATTPAAAA